jgi:DNA-binding CsgD family transcriptional regulator
LTIHSTRVVPADVAGCVLTRRQLSVLLSQAASACGLDGYLLAEIASPLGAPTADFVASNWSFDDIADLGLDTIAGIALGPLSTVPGMAVRLWEPADGIAACGEAVAATLVEQGRVRMASHRFTLDTADYAVLLSGRGGAGVKPAGVAQAYMTALYAMSRYRAPRLDQDGQEPANPVLTQRERECLFWVSEGKTSDEIATIVGLAGSTVNGHLATAMQKIGAPNRVTAMAIAIRQGLI